MSQQISPLLRAVAGILGAVLLVGGVMAGVAILSDRDWLELAFVPPVIYLGWAGLYAGWTGREPDGFSRSAS